MRSSKPDKDKTKLLMLMPTIQSSGAEEYALVIASAAVNGDWEVQAAFPDVKGTFTLVCDLEAHNIRYCSLDISDTGNPRIETKRKHLLRLLRTLILLRRFKPDAVHIVLLWPSFGLGSILACALLKIPTLVVFQLVPLNLVIGNRKLKAYTWARSRNQKWVAVSEYNRRIILKSFHISESEMQCIYNGTSVEPDTSVDDKARGRLRSQVRQELGLMPDSQLILTVRQKLWRFVHCTRHRKWANMLSAEDINNRILFAQPFFYCNASKPLLCRIGYLRRFAGISGTLGQSWSALSAFDLWNTYCH